VGKTTLAAAYAVRGAARQRRGSVLLISTDPAHSLADIFETKLGSFPRAIPISASRKLLVWQIDAGKQFRKFLDRHREAILDLVESGTIFSRREIEPLLDATLPGMAEFAALLAIRDLVVSGRYAEIVVDTAPLGHTLRLFEMPGHFARFLEFLDLAASRDRVLAERFGGTTPPSQPLVDEWRAIVSDVQQVFTGKDARITLVTTPETFALNESVRAAEALRRSDLEISGIILNRVVTSASGCPRCRVRARDTRAARAFLARHFRGAPLRMGENNGGPILGVGDLRALAAHVFDGRNLKVRRAPASPPKLKFEKVSWPQLGVPLSLTLGKGGVGKTTISAGLAVHHRAAHPRSALTICSTDPAPSLDDIFQQPVGGEPVVVLGDLRLRAMEMDAVREFHQWSERLKERVDRAFSTEAGGMHVDLSFDHRVIVALLDLVPPGVDEIFAIFRVLDLLSGQRRLLIDMAPTGHALELLRMPERLAQWSRLLLKTLAPHRTLPFAQDAAVEIAAVGQRVRELLTMLRDGRRAQVWPVMLAETLPDRETGRLLRQLHEMGVHTAPVFVNRVIFEEDVGRCARCRRAHAWQMSTLAGLRRRLAEMYVVRDFAGEIAGARSLKAFTRELWQLA
jgi:arsenite/tail-anchored protein-transporting ATPase